MDDNEDKPMKLKHAIALLIILIGIMGMVLSCSPKIIEKVIVQRDTTRVVIRDSVKFYDRDSIFVKEKGDTVYKYVEKWRWRDRVKIDTFYRVVRDSVTVESVKEVKVMQPLSKWKQAKLDAFWWLIGVVVLLLLWTFRKPIMNLIKLMIV